ncbi:MAG TPA: nucleotidyltransferase substrate binding protein [Pedobacter sp.]|jgi:nucleotidyltransferase substrate binding protein (TIGR01987 family)
MINQDIRWIQRFSNYKKALSQLQKFIDKGELNELEEQGLIQSFEYTYELAWNVIKDYYQHQGVSNIQGSRDAFRIAFNRELLSDGEVWMKMIESRIQTSHTYHEEIAAEIAEAIVGKYFDAFKELEQRLENLV